MSRPFYARAITSMWTQLMGLFKSAIGQIVATGVLAITYAGNGTPGVMYAVLVRYCVQSIITNQGLSFGAIIT